MEDSILTLVKQSCGITEAQTVFDKDIIMHINSVFMILRQMGVGPSGGYRIVDKDDYWFDFISSDDLLLYEGVKTYVCAKVRLLFDPPSSGSHKDALMQAVNEFEWRLNWEAELGLMET